MLIYVAPLQIGGIIQHRDRLFDTGNVPINYLSEMMYVTAACRYPSCVSMTCDRDIGCSSPSRVHVPGTIMVPLCSELDTMREHFNISRKLQYFCRRGLNCGSTLQIAASGVMCRLDPFCLFRAPLRCSCPHSHVEQRQKSQPLVRATAGFNSHESIVLSTKSTEVTDRGQVRR